MATFLWGTRDSWHAFNRRYLERVRELVTAEPPPQGMLCTEQDLWADVLVRRCKCNIQCTCSVHAVCMQCTVLCVRMCIAHAHCGVLPLQARHNADGHLATEFTTSDAGGWGWERAEPVSVTCGDGNVNIGNRCVADVGLCEGLACKSVSAAAAGAVKKRSG